MKKNLLFEDFTPVGEVTIDVKAKNVKRFFTGNIRLNKGYYRTDKEVEKYRKISLARNLP